jgi:hypothetical protein
MNENNQPDVVHVEDIDDIRRYMERSASRADLSYCGYRDLNTFMKELKDVNARARLAYVLDGEFFRTPQDTETSFLLPEAVKFIREEIRVATQIIINSGAAKQVQNSGLLSLNNVKFMEKPNAIPQEIIAALKG